MRRLKKTYAYWSMSLIGLWSKTILMFGMMMSEDEETVEVTDNLF